MGVCQASQLATAAVLRRRRSQGAAVRTAAARDCWLRLRSGGWRLEPVSGSQEALHLIQSLEDHNWRLISWRLGCCACLPPSAEG